MTETKCECQACSFNRLSTSQRALERERQQRALERERQQQAAKTSK